MSDHQTKNRAELARIIDHSVLKPEAGEKDVAHGADVVRAWGIGFYCVQPCWVAVAADALKGSPARVVSVIGFPHGCEQPTVKAHAAELAIRDGAGELDMVLNVGLLRSGALAAAQEDIATVVRAAAHTPVKVILEACLLTEDEKVVACRLVQDAAAAFVKTSTGFNPGGGATVADVRLLRKTVGPRFGVKAAGGIRTLAEARAMIEAGADRLGVSASAAILEALAV